MSTASTEPVAPVAEFVVGRVERHVDHPRQLSKSFDKILAKTDAPIVAAE
jgi:hypothetical protein